MSRVVIIGAGGFIGSHVAAALRDARPVCPSHTAADLEDPASLVALLQPGDLVINAAGYAMATDRTRSGLERLRAVNVQGVVNLSHAAGQAGVRQLIHISSIAAMGRVRGHAVPESAVGPVRTPYARSKRDAEAVLGRMRGHLPVTILRPTSVFGEGRGLARLLCRLLDAPVVPLPDGGRTLIPFTYVGNVAWAVRLCVGNVQTFGKTLCVGDQESYELRSVLERLASRLGRCPRWVSMPAPLLSAVATVVDRSARLVGRPAPIDSHRLATLTTSVCFSISQLQAATGYQPPFSLDDGLERIAAWYRGRSESGTKV